MRAALAGIFFLSGCAALLFEALWFRQALLAFGSSVWASSLVLSSFMTGIALGNGAGRPLPRLHRPAPGRLRGPGARDRSARPRARRVGASSAVPGWRGSGRSRCAVRRFAPFRRQSSSTRASSPLRRPASATPCCARRWRRATSRSSRCWRSGRTRGRGRSPRRAAPPSADVERLWALDHLARRSWSEAARRFEAALALGADREPSHPLAIYAHCRAGAMERVAELRAALFHGDAGGPTQPEDLRCERGVDGCWAAAWDPDWRPEPAEPTEAPGA